MSLVRAGKLQVLLPTLTFTGAPVAAQTFTLNGVVFTARASGAIGNEFNIGSTVTETAANVVAAVNASSAASIAGVGPPTDLTRIVVASSKFGVVSFTSRAPAVFTLVEALTNATATVIPWTLEESDNAVLTLTASRTLSAPTGMRKGHKYTLKVVQDAVGGWALSFDAVYFFGGGVAPTITAGIAAIDILEFWSDGTNMFMLVAAQDQS